MQLALSTVPSTQLMRVLVMLARPLAMLLLRLNRRMFLLMEWAMMSAMLCPRLNAVAASEMSAAEKIAVEETAQRLSRVMMVVVHVVGSAHLRECGCMRWLMV